MSPLQKAGTDTEDRFLALAQKQPGDPDWFISVTRASADFDARGVDMFAHIYLADAVGPRRVPIQVKSSYRGRESYGAVHPKNVEAGVLVIVVHKRDSDANIRTYLFTLLEQVHSQNKTYEDFLEQLLTERMSPRGRRNEKRIRTRQKK